MPLLLLPLLGTAAGFGAGYFTGSATKKVVLSAVALGGGYLVYKKLTK